MSEQKVQFETTFDDAATDYDESRPAYCQTLYQDLLAYQPLGPQSRVLEIGMGTGKATAPILETGCSLTALEPGAHLARLAKARLAHYANLVVVEKTLQDYECEDETFDLIYAATAFHWVPEEYGYPRVFAMLKKGGVFARFAYHAGPDVSRPELTADIQKVYDRIPSLSGKYNAFTDEQAKRRSEIARRYGFTETTYHIYHWTKAFSADAYMRLLRTYPNHMNLKEEERAALFSGIHHAIMCHGGVIDVHYTADMQLARKE